MLTLTWACACGMVAAKQPPATAATTRNLYARINLPQLWSDELFANITCRRCSVCTAPHEGHNVAKARCAIPPEILGALPARDISLFEVSLFCLIEHLAFRDTLPVAPYPALLRFCERFAVRPSAQHTVYRFDASPAG
jgi:hypothetical protein